NGGRHPPPHRNLPEPGRIRLGSCGADPGCRPPRGPTLGPGPARHVLGPGLSSMCGRFVQERSMTELTELFEAEQMADDLGPRYNVAPTDPAAVVVERPDGRR